MKRLMSFIALLSLLAPVSLAAIDYSTPGSVYRQEFDSLPNAPENTSLGPTPAGWMDDTSASGGTFSIPGFHLWHPIMQGEGGANGHQRMRIGAGSAIVGAFMSWGPSGSSERALGMLSSNTMAFGPAPTVFESYYGARFTNNTGIRLHDFTLAYTGEQWRDGGTAATGSVSQSIRLDYKVTSGTAAIQDAGFTHVPTLDFTGPVSGGTTAAALDGNLPENHTNIAPVTVSGINWGPGEDLWIRWTDVNDAGADHGLGIDNLEFSAIQGTPPPFNIFKWEYVNPNNRSLGKQQSVLLASDGYGLHAEPGLQASARNLANAFLIGANLRNAAFSSTNLTRAALDQADLTAADFSGANLTGVALSGAILDGAVIRSAKLSSTHITLDQLYSTASYQDHDLTGVHFVGNDLSGANLAGQQLASASFYAAKLVGADLTNADLTNAEFVNTDLSQANLTNADFTNATLAFANLSQAKLKDANFTGANLTSTNLMGADVRGARLGGVITYVYGMVCGRPSVGGCLYYVYGVVSTHTGGGVNLAQLSTTASYQAHDLSGIDLASTNLAGANFVGFNLTNAKFSGTTFTGADLSGADARGTIDLDLAGAIAANLIRPDGHVDGLDLGAGQSLSIRDYDGSVPSPIIPVTVEQRFAMDDGGTLRMVFEADAWDSTISFAGGIPVTLGGSLELALGAGVDPNSQIGRTFHIFDWTGVSPTGTFAIDAVYAWDLANLYTTGEVTLLSLSGSNRIPAPSESIPEPATLSLIAVGLVALWATRARRYRTLARRLGASCRQFFILGFLLVPCSRSFAEPPDIRLTKIAAPVWKPVDFQLFSAPATPFDAAFGQVYNALLPYDTPLASTYLQHIPPYDMELSAGMIAGGYVSQATFTPDAITLNPNGVYFAFMLVPAPGVTGSSRDFTSGAVIPHSVFPISSNIDVWLDGVLVDRTPGADALIPVQPRDLAFQGTSHLESLQAIWHPWDDDLTVGPLGDYDLRLSIRDVGGSGWDIVVPFKVTSELAGDANRDNQVTRADAAIVARNFGLASGATWYDGDFDGNGHVDLVDLSILQSHLSQSPLASGAAAVPEPSTFALAVLATVGLILAVPRRGGRAAIFAPEIDRRGQVG